MLLVRRSFVVVIGLGPLLAVTVASRVARAEPEVTLDTASQLYEVRSPSGLTLLTRQRLTSMLGVSGYDLLERNGNPNAPELFFRARLRYDADYGANGAEADVQNDARYVPGFERGPVDLMYAYVEGRRILSRWLGFRAGRQYVTDMLGWWSFDGATVRVTSPYYLAAEAFGGLEVRGGLALSTPRFERDGVWRGSRDRMDNSQWTSFVDNAVAPAYGAAIETVGIGFLQARASYRHVDSTGAAPTNPFVPLNQAQTTGTRLSQERMGMSLNMSFGEVAGAKAGFAYDLYGGRTQAVFASFDGYPSSRVTFGVDYDYTRPIFDADSIWNFFGALPTQHLGARTNIDVTPKLAMGLGTFARAFGNQTEASGGGTGSSAASFFPQTDATFTAGGDLSARYTLSRGRIGVRSDASGGYGGHRLGGDVFVDYTVENRILLQGRVSLWRWKDSLRQERSTDSIGYVAGVGYRLGARSRAMVELEHNANRLVGDRIRLMFWLTVAVTK